MCASEINVDKTSKAQTLNQISALILLNPRPQSYSVDGESSRFRQSNGMFLLYTTPFASQSIIFPLNNFHSY